MPRRRSGAFQRATAAPRPSSAKWWPHRVFEVFGEWRFACQPRNRFDFQPALGPTNPIDPHLDGGLIPAPQRIPNLALQDLLRSWRSGHRTPSRSKPSRPALAAHEASAHARDSPTDFGRAAGWVDDWRAAAAGRREGLPHRARGKRSRLRLRLEQVKAISLPDLLKRFAKHAKQGSPRRRKARPQRPTATGHPRRAAGRYSCR